MWLARIPQSKSLNWNCCSNFFKVGILLFKTLKYVSHLNVTCVAGEVIFPCMGPAKSDSLEISVFPTAISSNIISAFRQLICYDGRGAKHLLFTSRQGSLGLPRVLQKKTFHKLWNFMCYFLFFTSREGSLGLPRVLHVTDTDNYNFYKTCRLFVTFRLHWPS